MAVGRHVVGTTIGRYDLLRCIGRGATGVVYEGIDRSLGRRVAIKILRWLPPDDVHAARSVTRFLREGRVAARVRHAHVVDVHDFGIEDGRPFLVMELVEGESLAQRLQREGPLSVECVVEIVLPILSAVAELHTAGIVHRDIKPANILLRRGDDFCPKLADFGVSRFDDGSPSITRAGATIGTPAYMAPELILGQAPGSESSDQYAIGVMLYECATGNRPFQGATDYELMGAIVNGAPAPLSLREPRVPKAFDQVVMRALERNPERRFRCVDELAEALLLFASPSASARWRHEFVPEPAPLEWESKTKKARSLGTRPAPQTSRKRRVFIAAVLVTLGATAVATLAAHARAPLVPADDTTLSASTTVDAPAAQTPRAEPAAGPIESSSPPAMGENRARQGRGPRRGLTRTTATFPPPAPPAFIDASPVLGDNGAPILDVP
jgi:serine/threonine-protein kinase